jgi:hypothetical protein
VTEQELQEAVLEAKEAFSSAVATARDGGVTVNLWVVGTGPTNTGPSEVGVDFGDQ